LTINVSLINIGILLIIRCFVRVFHQGRLEMSVKKTALLLGIIALAVVIGFGTAGCKDDNDSGSGTPDTPANIVTTASSSSSILISWPAVSGALQYRVYISENSAGVYTLLGVTVPTDTGVCSYSANGLTPNTAYYFRISSLNSAGESAQSSPVSATIYLNLPSVPRNVGVTAASANSITVSWSAVSGAAGYHIYRSESASGAYTQVGTVLSSATSYTATGLLPNTTYYFKVSAYSSAGEGPQSSYTSAKTNAQ
jgi:cellulose 1,4-beta-cellobiosidase